VKDDQVLSVAMGDDRVESLIYARCERQETGYWLGCMRAGISGSLDLSTSLHIEILELKPKGFVTVNPDFQGHVDTWMRKNEECTPKVLTLGKRRFFMHVEPYAG
jgi:hypothetical protein